MLQGVFSETIFVCLLWLVFIHSGIRKGLSCTSLPFMGTLSSLNGP